MVLKRYKKEIYLVIFLIAISLRFFLALVNNDSNDNHFEVIKIIQNENRIPVKSDCNECYHPKFFHLFSAVILKSLPFLDIQYQIIVVQLINSLAGIITLYIIYLFLNKLIVDDQIKIIGFSLLAFNPKFLGINVQITNDSFVILFSTASIFFMYNFLKYHRKASFYFMIVFVVLSGLTKGNGIVVVGVLSLILLIRLFMCLYAHLERKKYILSLVLLWVYYLAIVPFFGQYIHNFVVYKDPFTLNVEKFFNTNAPDGVFPNRPGYTSFAQSFLTFRFIDLFRHPQISNYSIYPLHRTSLWTQLFGRTHFVHFDNWPPSWQASSDVVLNLGRIIFLLAIIPTIIFLYGFLFQAGLIVNPTMKNIKYTLKNNNELLFFTSTALFFFFIIIFTYSYRDFSAMKAIYIFPGLIGFFYIFIFGFHKILLILKNRHIKNFISFLMILLCLFYILDSSILILQLV